MKATYSIENRFDESIKSQDFKKYLTQLDYSPSYFKKNSQGYYNPRTRKTLDIPSGRNLKRKQLATLFEKNSKTIDLPPILEWYRFLIFQYQQ